MEAQTPTPTQSDEELEAALQEGIAPISESALDLQRRWHEIKAIMAPYESELKVIKELITEEMQKKGVNVLTYKGVPVAALVTSHRTKVDVQGLLTVFPRASKFISQTVVKRFDAKKLVT